MEANSAAGPAIAEKMSLPVSNFEPGYMREPVTDTLMHYTRLLLHICHEIKSLGFKVLVIGAGHYPLLDHARAAAALFHQEQDRPKMITWAMTGFELVRGRFDPCGDHGGKWETSLLMALDPGMQDLSLLPEDRTVEPVGVVNNGIQDASPQFGQQVAEAIIEEVRKRVEDFLANPDAYQGNGSPM